jgi:hypothetical protein
MRRTVMDEHLCTCACPPVSVPAWCTCTMRAQVRHPGSISPPSLTTFRGPGRTLCRSFCACVRVTIVSLRALLLLK